MISSFLIINHYQKQEYFDTNYYTKTIIFRVSFVYEIILLLNVEYVIIQTYYSYSLVFVAHIFLMKNMMELTKIKII